MNDREEILEREKIVKDVFVALIKKGYALERAFDLAMSYEYAIRKKIFEGGVIIEMGEDKKSFTEPDWAEPNKIKDQ